MKNRMHNNHSPSHLVGIGLDHHDGHKRITQAEQFSVLGGSQETHERLTVTLIRTFENLKKKGKTLAETEPQELSDIIKKSSEEA